MSFNHDIEGHTTDKSVLAAREEHKAWLMRQLMTSKGHKLLLAGNEFGNTHSPETTMHTADPPRKVILTGADARADKSLA